MVKNEPIVMPSPEMVEEYVNKAVKEAKIQQLEQLKAEFEEDRCILLNQITAIKIIDSHIEELKGDKA